MLMTGVEGGEVGVSRSSPKPLVLLQVLDYTPGPGFSIPHRAVLTVEEAEQLIQDLRQEIEAIRLNPAGVEGTQAEKAAEHVMRYGDVDAS